MGLSYSEAGVFIAATYRGELGLYCLSMPVTDDVAMIGGRETSGFPKKIAEEITLERDEQRVTSRVVPKGTEILTVQAELTDPADPNDPELFGPLARDLEGRACHRGIVLRFKTFLGPGTRLPDYLPRLVRVVTLTRPRDDQMTGIGTLALHSSAADPLGEIPVRDVISVTYGTSDATMLPGKVVARAWNIRDFSEHGTAREDMLAYLLDSGRLVQHTRAERRRLCKAVRSY
jgi:acetoacetate decarboxylase